MNIGNNNKNNELINFTQQGKQVKNKPFPEKKKEKKEK